MIFNMTGGGAPLNFKVVPNPQPDTAKENTIWVDTDRINNYYFSATQPKNMVNYDVWFPVGTSSTVEFNALKKDGIQVYPLSAKQMISGALVDKAAKSYQNGAWHEWFRYLYQNGNEFTNLTGGWNIQKTAVGTVTKTANSIEFAITGTNAKWTYGAINTKNKINLSDVSLIRLNDDWITSTDNNGLLPMLAISTSASLSINSNDGNFPSIIASSTSGELSLDGITGEYYVFVISVINGVPSFYANLKISEVSLA